MLASIWISFIQLGLAWHYPSIGDSAFLVSMLPQSLHAFAYLGKKVPLFPITGIGINDKVQEKFVIVITPGGIKFSTELNFSQITTIPPPA